jgi:tetratricopeptide (TPR) repeat protein
MMGNPARGERRQVVPPPPLPRLAGLDALRGVEDAAGLELWLSARHVHDWLDTPAADRAGLIPDAVRPAGRSRRAEALELAPELAGALDVLRRVAADPLEVDGARVAGACVEAAEWVESRGVLPLAAALAEAAAYGDPEAPARANVAARICRRAAEWDRAAAWYQRAIGLARRQRDAREFIRGQLGYGAFWYNQGRLNQARPHLSAAAWRARRAGLHEQAAHAWHDLLLVCAELGEYTEAEDYARRAATAYPLHARRLPYLAADLAVTLIFRRYYTSALPLLDAFVSKIEQPAEQVLALSNQAHAAAGIGDVARFRRLTSDVLELLELYDEHAPAALVNLAAGAYALHDWDMGERCARMAVERAQRRNDREPERRARGLLAAITARTPAPGETPAPAGAAGRQLRDLTRELVARLARWTPDARTARRRATPGESVA